MESPDDMLQAVAQTLAGEDGCCRIFDEAGRCCMTENARAVFEMIEARGGPGLDECERIASGEARIMVPIRKGGLLG